MAENNNKDDDIDTNIIHDVKQVPGGDGGAISWRLPFQIITTLLLSLLLPLSFLLIARLSAARYLSNVWISTPSAAAAPASAIASFLLNYNGKAAVLYALVSLVTVAALVHGLTAPALTLIPDPTRELGSRQPAIRVYISWILLCAFQLCVGLGVEGSISAGIDGSAVANESINNLPTIVIRALLFVGLHETMSFWSSTVVKPVVEDTVGGDAINGGGRLVAVERFGGAVSLGALWWWRLREEVDALVVVPELMLASGGGGAADVLVVLGVAELVGWWLYYLTVSIGTMRVLKVVIWVGIRMLLVSWATVRACRDLIDRRREGEGGGGEKLHDYDISDYVAQSYRRLHLPLEDTV